MSTPFQNRLVGTVIVAAMAIIFLPDLLDGDKKTYQEEFDRIPAAPTIDFKPQGHSFPQEKLAQLDTEELSDEVALDDEQMMQSEQQTKAQQDTPLANETTKVEVLPKPDTLDNTQQKLNSTLSELPSKAVANEAWVIQLGSFRHKNNVDDLVNKLTAAGYKAFTRPIKTKTGTLTKVFVGPELIKTSLEKKIPALKSLTKVEGKIARFSPTK